MNSWNVVRIMVCGILIAAQRQTVTASDISAALRAQRWISYAPTHYYPAESAAVLPSEASVRADLRTLREAGFTGIITYGAELEMLPKLAQEAGFKGMVLGIWDPGSQSETQKALNVIRAYEPLIVG